MKTKILSIILMTAILIASVSALDFSLTTPSGLTKSKTQTSFIITNTGSENIDVTITSPSTLTDSEGNSITITTSPLTISNLSGSETIDVSYTGDLGDLLLGEYNKQITVYAEETENSSLNNSKTTELTVSNNYCLAGEQGGNISINDIEFTNNGEFGEDDEWFLTNEIEVEIEVENNGDEDIDDIVVEWGLYDEQNNEFIIDEEEDDFNLDDNEEETLTISFTLDPDDFDEDFNEDDFVFYVKAYSDDLGESNECTSEKDSITMRKDDHFVVIDNINLVSEVIPCDGLIEGDFQIWNIGDDDEEEISVVIREKRLGIINELELGDLDILEDKNIPFTLEIPEDADERTYGLIFEVLDEDNDIFENDDDEAIFSKVFEIQGNCQTDEQNTVAITAQLDSETPTAVPGKQVIVKATLRNTGDSETNYLVSIFGNSAWSSLVSLEPTAVTLEPNEEGDINIALSIDEDAEGEKEFTIRAIHGEKVTEQKVSLAISQETQETQLGPVLEHLRENWFIYLIAIINIILIIAIIIVVSRMVSRG